MDGKKTCILFLFVLLCFSLSRAQEIFPPEPMMATQQETALSPCGSGDGGTGSVGIPPPKGLCLPINDYLLPLFLSGVFLGAFSLFDFKKKQASSAAA